MGASTSAGRAKPTKRLTDRSPHFLPGTADTQATTEGKVFPWLTVILALVFPASPRQVSPLPLGLLRLRLQSV